MCTSSFPSPLQFLTIASWGVYVVDQNEIQVKKKFFCLLTLIIQGSWINGLRRPSKIENQTILKSLYSEFYVDLQNLYGQKHNQLGNFMSR